MSDSLFDKGHPTKSLPEIVFRLLLRIHHSSANIIIVRIWYHI